MNEWLGMANIPDGYNGARVDVNIGFHKPSGAVVLWTVGAKPDSCFRAPLPVMADAEEARWYLRHPHPNLRSWRSIVVD